MQHSIITEFKCSHVHNVQTQNSRISICDCSVIIQPESTLAPLRGKKQPSHWYSHGDLPLYSPVLTTSADPHFPPASPSNSCYPTLPRLPSRASLSYDLERHHHLPKAAVLPEKVELSQSPRGVQPSVPLFLWFSHH